VQSYGQTEEVRNPSFMDILNGGHRAGMSSVIGAVDRSARVGWGSVSI
jgi:hypothetical protein